MTQQAGVPLGELADFVMGQAPPSSACNIAGEGTPFVKAGEFSVRRPVVREWTTRPLKIATTNDVLVCVVGATAGKVNQGIDCAIGRSVAAIRPRSQRLRSEYLYWFMTTQVGVLRRASQGLAQGVITRDMLAQIHVALPAIEEQQRIAAVLDQADALRARRTQALSSTDRLLDSIFFDMFGDPIANLRQLPLRALSDWVDDKAPITYGILKPGPNVPSGVPYVRVLDIRNGSVEPSNVRKTTADIDASYARSRLHAGDLVISIRGHVGRMGVVPAELDGANITQDSARIRLPPDARAYVAGALSTAALQRWMASRTKGVAVRGINLGDLRQAPLPVPPDKEMVAFSTRTEQLRSFRGRCVRQLEDTEALFASIQTRAFAGDL